MKLKNYRKWDLVERGIALFLLLWFAYLMFAARNLKPEEINNKLTVAWIVSVFIFLAIIFIILPIINKLKKKIKKK